MYDFLGICIIAHLQLAKWFMKFASHKYNNLNLTLCNFCSLTQAGKCAFKSENHKIKLDLFMSSNNFYFSLEDLK